jgi:hypothetical protein
VSSQALQHSPQNQDVFWNELPFLLRLMDDASPAVRAKVRARLCARGEKIWPHIEAQNISISPAQRHALREMLAGAPRWALISRWPDWLQLESENEKIEAAFAWLCDQRSSGNGALMREALDDLTHQFLQSGGGGDPEELGAFLFQERRLRGASPDEYYSPQNCDLLEVLRSGKGLPISLACVFILVGARLDITIYGCNFPGHFLARAPLWPDHLSEDDLVFDPFNGGRILTREEVAALAKAAPHELSTPASARAIIARVLQNLANAHRQAQEEERVHEVLSLLRQLENAA